MLIKLATDRKIMYFLQRYSSICGSTRIHVCLIDDGEDCCEKSAARLMQAVEINSKLTKKFVITSDPNNTLAPVSDRVKRDFTAEGTGYLMCLLYHNPRRLDVFSGGAGIIFTASDWLGDEHAKQHGIGSECPDHGDMASS